MVFNERTKYFISIIPIAFEYQYSSLIYTHGVCITRRSDEKHKAECREQRRTEAG